MSISAAEVKKLRDATNAGYGDCRKALIESNGDQEEAVKILRTKGRAKAEKKQSRATGEGLVKFQVAQDGKSAAIVEVNCETDFVSRETSFSHFTDKLLELVLSKQLKDIDAVKSHEFDGQTSVEAARENLVLQLGENIQISRVEYFDGSGFYFGYQHGVKLAVLVALDKNNAELGREVAIHIAAMDPVAISEKDLPTELLEKERSIYKAQLDDSDKPDAIKDKIIDGKMKKFSAGLCLNSQAYVKDPNMTVEALLKPSGCEVKFIKRIALGDTA